MFKKILLLAGAVSFSFLLISKISAAGIPTGSSMFPPATDYSAELTTICVGDKDNKVVNAIGTFINFFLGFVGAILLIAVVYGGWQYLTDFGSGEKAKGGITAIQNGVIGLVIVTLSYTGSKLLLEGMPKGEALGDVCAGGIVSCTDDECFRVPGIASCEQYCQMIAEQSGWIELCEEDTWDCNGQDLCVPD